MILELEKFHAFELAGWESIPDDYHQAFGALTTQAIEPLLDAVRVKKGTKLLDIASGPGYGAAAATYPGPQAISRSFTPFLTRAASSSGSIA